MNYEKIKKYLKNELPEKEMNNIRQEIKTNLALAKKVEGVKGLMLLNRGEREAEIVAEVENIDLTISSGGIRPIYRWIGAVAAVLLVGVLMFQGYNYFQTEQLTKQLAAWKVEAKEEVAAASLGPGGVIEDINIAISLLEDGKFEEAKEKLLDVKNRLIPKEEVYPDLQQITRLMLSYAYLNLKECKSAAQELIEFEKKTTDNYLKEKHKALKEIANQMCN